MTRYAIYGVPGAESGAPEAAVRVREAALRWFARDDVRAATSEPRRYGFHATLKAPFRLAPGRAEGELAGALARFAAAQAPIVLPGLHPAPIGSFRALVPTEQTAIAALAARIVAEFELFRAPLTADEVARRRPERLSARQRELLDAYGYPYVLDEFRVHLTLTNALADGAAGAIDERIVEHFSDVAGADVPLTALTLAIEREPGAPFEILRTFPLDAQEPAR
ncbi:DUF1045 domain-containing protein [Microbacterium karelineae]|uniref:DUF1045 domain-containing protein n=1 Tax=Microbacterium karelineae TaxID=2654283 RepID=UPI0012EA4B49|nr:DUF1045 domain-containing protein [Microbacterium karelineae]